MNNHAFLQQVSQNLAQQPLVSTTSVLVCSPKYIFLHPSQHQYFKQLEQQPLITPHEPSSS